ncbi:MAG TPA: hypothetical protein VK892_18860, partial [Pyrinomonadaceae bacterium]|nr:hypothetical protein [Pyrinomonadaceae bacterium]
FPNDARPIRFFNGAAGIIEKVGKSLTLPLAFRFEHHGNFKPEIFVKIGEPDLIVVDNSYESKSMTDFFSKRMTEILDELKNDVINNKTESYRKII